MPTLTKDNAKERCRTCLRKLDVNDEGSCLDDPPVTLHPEDDEMQDFKNIFINITTNPELQLMIAKYVDSSEVARALGFPQNLCLVCYNKLQSFEKFRKRAKESAEKLNAIFNSCDAVTKVEIEEEDCDRGEGAGVISNDDDIYKLLLKDSLMETESVLLEGGTVANLSNVEMHAPDPFDNATESVCAISLCKMKRQSNETLSYNDYDWQSKDNNVATSSDDEVLAKKLRNSRSFDSVKQYIKSNELDDETGEDDDVESDQRATHLGSSKNPAHNDDVTECGLAQSTRKHRRTKKEMDECRPLQPVTTCPSQEHKFRRRNKGTKNSFKCEKCNHSFAHKITLDAHVRKVHEGNKRPFQCDRCDKAYTFIGGLYTHIKEIHETEVRSYNCDHPGCDRIYTSFIAMQKHKRLKHSDEPLQNKYVCEQCGATFNQSGNLKYHRRTKHPTEAEQLAKEKCKERFECGVCQKQFHSRYTLKYHTLQLHSDDMKYECNVCGRRMAKKFMLVQHMLVHSTDKMPCEHCGKQFIRKFELEAHIRAVHMKLKPFECQYCSECFASRKTLRHHEYIHTGEKPYVCEVCGQAYRQQTCLKNHRKTHDKLGTEALLAANVNRTLISSLLVPQPSTTGLATGTAETTNPILAKPSIPLN